MRIVFDGSEWFRKFDFMKKGIDWRNPPKTVTIQRNLKKKCIFKIHEDVVHQLVDQNALRPVFANNDHQFRLQRPQNPLKSVSLVEHFSV